MQFSRPEGPKKSGMLGAVAKAAGDEQVGVGLVKLSIRDLASSRRHATISDASFKIWGPRKNGVVT